MSPENKIKRSGDHWLAALVITAAFTVLNIAASFAARAADIPIIFESIGTILAAALGGYLPGIAVGFLTGVIGEAINGYQMYYGAVYVLTAAFTAFFASKGYFRRMGTTLAASPVIAGIGGIFGTVVIWMLSGFGRVDDYSTGVGRQLALNTKMNIFWSTMVSGFALDLIVVIITLIASYFMLKAVNNSALAERFGIGRFSFPDRETLKLNDRRRFFSLRNKVILTYSAIMLIVAIASTFINIVQYHNATIAENTELCTGIAEAVAENIDGDRIDDFIEKGDSAEGYTEIENRLYNIRRVSPKVEYIYVYRILEDGCHVVFDLDSEEVEGSEPGDLIEFDEAFYDSLPNLLAGKEIDPIISNDSYGWLLTVYKPVTDSNGKCQCYAAVDLSMGQLTADEVSNVTRTTLLFFSVFLLLLTIGLRLADGSIITPVNTIARAADSISYDTEEARRKTLETMESLDIRTKDEIENLRDSFRKTTEDTVRYIEEAEEKSRQIAKMQNGLIIVLADIVESRDKCTGDHIKKTAAYTRVIMDQLRKEGIYTDELTDDFVEDVVSSAPLHDVGKIQVPDAILCKPGKLTDEEFEKIKTHTTAGLEVISQAMKTVSDDNHYLREAKNLAGYHHEKWNGTGYPNGLKGEEIPLSARIMAVADVFDALVSRRSYKEPFPIEKALDIIREGSGSHFDPSIAKAFLDAEDKVREIASKNMNEED
ncbi:MAG: HD domain-containing protein [Clostridia bacterium]|nr:HD domain-containing protein [Clostridia bacterium]